MGKPLKQIPKDVFVRNADHKRRGNIEIPVPMRIPAVVRRTRDRLRTKDIQIEPAPADTISATAQQLALAGGAGLPIFRDGLGDKDQSSYGSVGMGIRLANGNVIYSGGEVVIVDRSAETVRALFLHAEQSVTEARTRLTAAITERDAAQLSVDTKEAAWKRAIEHSDKTYAAVLALRKQQAEAKSASVESLLSTGVISPPRSVAVSLELQKAEQAFEVSTKARATVLADLQERKHILARAEEIVLGHAFEVTMAESSLLAAQAREAISTAQHALESLHALEAVSIRHAKGDTRPQTISPAAVETMRMLANPHADAAQTEQWAEYVTRLTKDSTATKESQA